MENKCDECGKKSKVCYLSNNKRYKLYICKECKSKEENETSNINKPSCDVHNASQDADRACWEEDCERERRGLSE